MITIAVIWFGIGELAKYFLIFWGTFFIVLINTAAGVSRTPMARQRAAQCLGASNLQIFMLIILPSAVPYIIIGMRIAMASSFMSIIPAEMLAAGFRARPSAADVGPAVADGPHLRRAGDDQRHRLPHRSGVSLGLLIDAIQIYWSASQCRDEWQRENRSCQCKRRNSKRRRITLLPISSAHLDRNDQHSDAHRPRN